MPILAVHCPKDEIPISPTTSKIPINNLEEIKESSPYTWNNYMRNISFICPSNYSAYYQNKSLENPSGFTIFCDSDQKWKNNISNEPIESSVFVCIRKYSNY